jgi:hypothetical protein
MVCQRPNRYRRIAPSSLFLKKTVNTGGEELSFTFFFQNYLACSISQMLAACFRSRALALQNVHLRRCPISQCGLDNVGRRITSPVYNKPIFLYY